jgi:hypothetical protein
MRLFRTIALLSLLAAPAAFADTLNVQSTGLAPVGNADPNYTLVSAPAGASSTVATVSTANGNWYQPTGVPQWIDPSGSGDGAEPFGIFVYTTTFTIGAGEDPSTAILNLNFAADDLVGILLNGNSVFGPGGSFSSLTALTVNSGFQIGVNTLEFDVDNSGGGPTGLYVEASGSVTPVVPEPSSIALLGTGLLSVAGVARRKFLRA